MNETADTFPATVGYRSLKHLLTPRAREAHKGDFGHVLVVGGDRGLGGAALMAGEAAARVGAGLTSVATHPSHALAFISRRPELMARGVEKEADLHDLLSRASVIVAGPGLGHSAWSRLMLETVFRAEAGNPIPAVVDADALNLISEGFLAEFIEPFEQWILTPHPGEAARLLRSTTREIQQDRPGAAKELQRRYGGVAILKGAGTLICHRREGRQYLERCNEGNPGMATGGMGDILSGVLGGLLAQHYSLADAARLGVCLHAASADEAAAASGERGLLATDLLPHLQRLVNPV